MIKNIDMIEQSVSCDFDQSLPVGSVLLGELQALGDFFQGNGQPGLREEFRLKVLLVALVDSGLSLFVEGMEPGEDEETIDLHSLEEESEV